jgi:tetratricopeptide (TPR) repeat protein
MTRAADALKQESGPAKAPVAPLSSAATLGDAVTSGNAATPSYVGRQLCSSCHTREHESWQGSHHDSALQEASTATVLGNFNGVRFAHSGESLEFKSPKGVPTVNVVQQGQPPRSYPVKYTFGIEPLQQYLLEMGDGRLQPLAVAWDTRPQAQGGKRWFHLQGKELVPPGDPLHWQGPQYNWNFMCADCHSTGVERGFDKTTERYATTFAEQDVSCESCHGPGSAHVAWAQNTQKQAWDSDHNHGLIRSLSRPKARRWVLREGARIASLEGSRPNDNELQTCAPCHSRRSDLGVGKGSTFYDRYRLSLLEEQLYFPDGQIKDEVFEIGSFLQSKMHAQGVTCSDCHEPHSQELRRPGNALCATCHRAEAYDSPQHHFHSIGSEAALCTSCHMPATIYMVVDPRRDHAMKVPHPGLSQKIGAPDPCTSCHVNKTQKWAHEEIVRRYPAHSDGGTADLALWLARAGQPGAAQALHALIRVGSAPVILRATALEELAAFPGPAFEELVRASARAPDPLLRRAAATAARGLEQREGAQLVLSLLDDPVRSVRIEAVGALLDYSPQFLSSLPQSEERVVRALAEYKASREASADRAEALCDLATLAAWSGKSEEAERLLDVALKRDPTFSPAYLNRADFYRARGENERALQALEVGLKRAADPAVLQHSKGLTLVRLGRHREGLAALRIAFETSPDRSRFGYVYAIALFDLGDKAKAISVLESIVTKRPGDAPVLQILVAYLQQLGEVARAEEYARKLKELLAH